MACEESASIDWARVMRGIASIAKLVTPASASARTVSSAVSGWRKPTSTEPRPSRPISSALGGATFATTSPEKPSPSCRPGLLVGGVGLVRALAGAGLDDHLDAALGEALDDLRHERDAPLAARAFPWVPRRSSADREAAASYTAP